MISTEVFQILTLIAQSLGMFGGIMFAYYLIDRKLERKISKYSRKARNSPEGKDFAKILKDTRTFFEGGEVQKFFREAQKVLTEGRALLKALSERFATSEEEESEPVELPVMPSAES